MVVCAFKSAEGAGSSGDWLNPTEGGATTYETNLQYLNMAVSAFTEHKMAEDQGEAATKKRRKEETKAEDRAGGGAAPFTRFLVPVLPSLAKEDSESKEMQRAGSDGERGAVTSDELLDCMLDPQVVSLVAQLLVNRRLGKS
ncbi:HSPB1-associated protein 1-like [Hyla sarda]|uniref:HSPB1-associated protein 1-like n=1 Tax=Hyla sarda TaxID=327740 RepID=UPI0024C3352C|nr:HSPB1-associated protein 1-like [Hyla sarda]